VERAEKIRCIASVDEIAEVNMEPGREFSTN
jgi:hypothetical protein